MTLGNMRENGVRSLSITCGALHCHHDAIMDVSNFADDEVSAILRPAHGLHGLRCNRCRRAAELERENVENVMRKALCFYWLCVRRAWSGSVEKANAMANILGTAIFAIVLWSFGYQLIVPDKGGEAVAFGLLCIFAAWLVIFTYRFLGAPAALYWEADEKAKVLAAGLVPNLKVFLNARNGGVNTLQLNPLQKSIQITVQGASDLVSLIDCEVWVNKIQRVNGDEVIAELIEEPIMATWSQAPLSQNRRRDISAMVPQAANFFSLADIQTPRLEPKFDHVKQLLFDEIQKPGRTGLKRWSAPKNARPSGNSSCSSGTESSRT